MAQTIKRGGRGVRRAAAARGAARKVDRAKAHTGSALDAAMRWLPFTEEQLHRVFLGLIFAMAAAVAWIVASLAGLPALLQAETAQLAANAGFEVRRVEVRGVEHMNELKVYERVLGERDRAMPLVDLDAVRGDLLGLSWVKDARVSRQLPDTLVVDIVEREPHAVLRKPNRLVLIDATGAELEPISTAAAKGRLIVSGSGAAQQVPELGRLLDAAPALKPQVAEAEWVGNRRWNLSFHTGEVLALPEGEDLSQAALINFARMDGVNRLLGKGVTYFDLRDPERAYLRRPRSPAKPEGDALASAAEQ